MGNSSKHGGISNSNLTTAAILNSWIHLIKLVHLQTGDTIQWKPLRSLMRYRTTIAKKVLRFKKNRNRRNKHSVLIFNLTANHEINETGSHINRTNPNWRSVQPDLRLISSCSFVRNTWPPMQWRHKPKHIVPFFTKQYLCKVVLIVLLFLQLILRPEQQGGFPRILTQYMTD